MKTPVLYHKVRRKMLDSTYFQIIRGGLEPKFRFRFEYYRKFKKGSQEFSLEKYLCTIWEDVRTYLTSSIDPKEKAELIVAIAHFKKEAKQ